MTDTISVRQLQAKVERQRRTIENIKTYAEEARELPLDRRSIYLAAIVDFCNNSLKEGGLP